MASYQPDVGITNSDEIHRSTVEISQEEERPRKRRNTIGATPSSPRFAPTKDFNAHAITFTKAEYQKEGQPMEMFEGTEMSSRVHHKTMSQSSDRSTQSTWLNSCVPCFSCCQSVVNCCDDFLSCFDYNREESLARARKKRRKAKMGRKKSARVDVAPTGFPITKTPTERVEDHFHLLTRKYYVKTFLPKEERIPLHEAGDQLMKARKAFRFIDIYRTCRFGQVYQASPRDYSEWCWIKVVCKSDEMAVKSIKNELVCLKVVQGNPFFLELIGQFQTPTGFYIVSNFEGRCTLETMVRKYEYFTNEQTRFYASELIGAVAFLHEQGIIHRLSATNCMLDEDGHVVLTDFGFVVFGHSSDLRLFDTPPYFYLAPEMIKGNRYDKSVDWWAVGVIVYLMLYGSFPFKGSSGIKVLTQIVEKTPDFPPEEHTKEAIGFCKQLLVKLDYNRLGFGANGSYEVAGHRYFQSVNWAEVQSKTKDPPFLPPISAQMYLGPSETESVCKVRSNISLAEWQEAEAILSRDRDRQRRQKSSRRRRSGGSTQSNLLQDQTSKYLSSSEITPEGSLGVSRSTSKEGSASRYSQRSRATEKSTVSVGNKKTSGRRQLIDQTSRQLDFKRIQSRGSQSAKSRGQLFGSAVDTWNVQRRSENYENPISSTSAPRPKWKRPDKDGISDSPSNRNRNADFKGRLNKNCSADEIDINELRQWPSLKQGINLQHYFAKLKSERATEVKRYNTEASVLNKVDAYHSNNQRDTFEQDSRGKAGRWAVIKNANNDSSTVADQLEMTAKAVPIWHGQEFQHEEKLLLTEDCKQKKRLEIMPHRDSLDENLQNIETKILAGQAKPPETSKMLTINKWKDMDNFQEPDNKTSLICSGVFEPSETPRDDIGPIEKYSSGGQGQCDDSEEDTMVLEFKTTRDSYSINVITNMVVDKHCNGTDSNDNDDESDIEEIVMKVDNEMTANNNNCYLNSFNRNNNNRDSQDKNDNNNNGDDDDENNNDSHDENDKNNNNGSDDDDENNACSKSSGKEDKIQHKVPILELREAMQMVDTPDPFTESDSYEPKPNSNTFNSLTSGSCEKMVESSASTYEPLKLSNVHEPLTAPNTIEPWAVANTFEPVTLLNPGELLIASNTGEIFIVPNARASVAVSNTHENLTTEANQRLSKPAGGQESETPFDIQKSVTKPDTLVSVLVKPEIKHFGSQGNEGVAQDNEQIFGSDATTDLVEGIAAVQTRKHHKKSKAVHKSKGCLEINVTNEDATTADGSSGAKDHCRQSVDTTMVETCKDSGKKARDALYYGASCRKDSHSPDVDGPDNDWSRRNHFQGTDLDDVTLIRCVSRQSGSDFGKAKANRAKHLAKQSALKTGAPKTALFLDYMTKHMESTANEKKSVSFMKSEEKGLFCMKTTHRNESKRDQTPRSLLYDRELYLHSESAVEIDLKSENILYKSKKCHGKNFPVAIVPVSKEGTQEKVATTSLSDDSDDNDKDADVSRDRKAVKKKKLELFYPETFLRVLSTLGHRRLKPRRALSSRISSSIKEKELTVDAFVRRPATPHQPRKKSHHLKSPVHSRKAKATSQDDATSLAEDNLLDFDKRKQQISKATYLDSTSHPNETSPRKITQKRRPEASGLVRNSNTGVNSDVINSADDCSVSERKGAYASNKAHSSVSLPCVKSGNKLSLLIKTRFSSAPSLNTFTEFLNDRKSDDLKGRARASSSLCVSADKETENVISAFESIAQPSLDETELLQRPKKFNSEAVLNLTQDSYKALGILSESRSFIKPKAKTEIEGVKLSHAVTAPTSPTSKSFIRSSLINDQHPVGPERQTSSVSHSATSFITRERNEKKIDSHVNDTPGRQVCSHVELDIFRELDYASPFALETSAEVISHCDLFGSKLPEHIRETRDTWSATAKWVNACGDSRTGAPNTQQPSPSWYEGQGEEKTKDTKTETEPSSGIADDSAQSYAKERYQRASRRRKKLMEESDEITPCTEMFKHSSSSVCGRTRRSFGSRHNLDITSEIANLKSKDENRGDGQRVIGTLTIECLNPPVHGLIYRREI